MSWLANFEDGRSIGAAKCHWIDLPKDKKITGVQLVNPNSPKTFVCLRNYDRYYFAIEAVAAPGTQGQPVAEILGGHNLDLGVGTEIRMEFSGSVKVRTYPLSIFKFTDEILRDGLKNGKPVLDTMPSEESV